MLIPASAVVECPCLLERLLAGVASRHQTDDVAVAGSSFLARYVRRIAIPALTCLVVERRAPDMSADNLILWFEHGLPHEVTLVAPRCAILPGDLAYGQPGVIMVDDPDGLRAWLHERLITEHLAALVARLRPLTRRGPRALWATVSDACAGVFLTLSRSLGVDQCKAEAEAFLAAGPPLVAAQQLVPFAHSGRRELFMRRATCCLNYRLPGHGYCTSCPALSSQEREHRLRAYLEPGIAEEPS